MNTIELLQSFCGKDDIRPHLMNATVQVVHGTKYYIATDALKLIMIPYDSVDRLEITNNKDYPRIKDVVNFELKYKATISISEIQKAIELSPKIDELDYSHQIKCAECDGEGEIECEECGHSYTCDRCGGEGVVGKPVKTGNLVIDNFCFTDLFGVKINGEYLQTIKDVMEYCKSDTVDLKDSPSRVGQLFSCGDVWFVIAPCVNEEEVFYSFR